MSNPKTTVLRRNLGAMHRLVEGHLEGASKSLTEAREHFKGVHASNRVYTIARLGDVRRDLELAEEGLRTMAIDEALLERLEAEEEDGP